MKILNNRRSCLRKLALVVILFIFSICLFYTNAFAGPESKEPVYLGLKWCKACHKGKRYKYVYEKWAKTKHANAYEVLNEEEKKNPECLKCHTTGYGEVWRKGVTPEELQGVQCEACHGPGSQYKPYGVMKNREKAIAVGMILPTKETCFRCHK